ncbi:hypothetical protein EOS_33035 [Caballeronia mineralivorans PML1(12)]|uniref:Helix-turn-helix domain-containing protein n=1 Tax=Caballeronia mineralivorans PML1(12) TaxID=908627 RepID=A0A0J1FQD9_9BURK|nr:helix-turn-helix domain-containing protein [Caballeronia mineralivorans]KLU21968.1 hypothetical protein EOS_33035 [Caballeronia mineralivorans PML1(12)]
MTDHVTEGQGDDLISVTEVAVLLAVGRTTVFRLAKEQGFPKAFKLGNKIIKYSRIEMLAWLKSKKDR